MVKLASTRRGAGPLLVCHPGGPGFSRAELADLGGLDATRELVLVDPRGTGATGPAETYRLDDYVADLDGLREDLALEAVDLLGFSHGGIVAIAYAAAFWSRVSRLLLVDTLACWGDEAEGAMQRAIETRRDKPWFEEAQKAIAEEQAGEFSSIEELVANLQRQAPLYFHRWEGNEQTGRELFADFVQSEPLHHFNTVEFPTFDLRGELRTIAAPTLVVVGDDDLIAGPVCADTMLRELPDARLVTIRDAGHFVYVEQPAAFRAALTDFLL